MPVVVTVAMIIYLPLRGPSVPAWTDAELASIQSLWLENLPPLPASPTNAVANNLDAARLGQQLFFDTRLSKNGKVSCATCHQPDRFFTDGLVLAQGVGLGTRNTQSVVGTAYSPWFFWNGRKDSLWSQALAPLESPIEHGGNRLQYAEIIKNDSLYREQYESLFDPIPEILTEEVATQVLVNIGKSVEAYQRLMLPGESRFDRYVDHIVNGTTYPAQDILNATEARGLQLFIGKAQCINCHNGPLFTNFSFHNTGILPLPSSTPDLGRIEGAQLVKEDPFNCLGAYSDDSHHRCDELAFMKEGVELIGAQKTPSLRNLEGTEPYMHAGQFATLAEVLQHYNETQGAIIGHNEAIALNFSRDQLQSLEAFLHSLAAPIAVDPQWLSEPPEERRTVTQNK